MNKERVCNAIVVENILSNTKESITLRFLENKGFTESDSITIMSFLSNEDNVTPDLIYHLGQTLDISMNVIYDFSESNVTFCNRIRRIIKSYKKATEFSLEQDLNDEKHSLFLKSKIASYSNMENILAELQYNSVEEFFENFMDTIESKRKSIRDTVGWEDNLELSGSLNAYTKISNVLCRFI